MHTDVKLKTRRTLTNQAKKDLIMVGIIVALFALFSVIANGFFSVRTVTNVIKQVAAIGICTYGMVFIMLTGGIDLAGGSGIALAGAVGALVMQALGGGSSAASSAPMIMMPGMQLPAQEVASKVPEFVVFLAGFGATMATACLMQAISGIVVGLLGVNAFITTLAMQYMARGLALTVMKADRVLVSNQYYNWFGQKTLFGYIPASFILVLVAFVVAYFILNRTKFGRRTYAVGGNPMAARATGINVQKHVLLVYILSGVFLGFAAMIVVGRASSAQPYAGQGFEFSVITAAILGGCSLSGGEGNLRSTTLGILAFGIITTGLSMFSVTPFFDYLIKGGLILGAVLLNMIDFDVIKKNKENRKQVKLNAQNAASAQSAVADAADHNGMGHQLEFKNISKLFPGVVALDNVSLKVRPGTVHALCGENGAGKSTLMKVLSGVYQKDGGEIFIDGKEAEIKSPIDSRKKGIAVIYQELSVVPELNVYQNMFLGKEILSKIKPFIDRRSMSKKAKALLKEFDLDININSRIADYTVGQQQMIEIAKAVGSNSWLLVMDEPTSAITENDKKNLFRIIEGLKKKGISIIYISHRMQEIMEIADDVTVLRDGKYVGSLPIGEVDEQKLIRMMIGRELNDVYTREKNELGEVVLEVKNLYRRGVFEPISFKVHEGEVLGFSGLIGAGRTEIMRCLFGLDKADGGEIYVRGKKVHVRSPKDSVDAGIVLISEDRRREGIVPLMSVRENSALPSLDDISTVGVLNKKKERAIADKCVADLNVKTPSIEQKIGNLSGGNQQKVCVGKWLAKNPQIIIMDEPTRGIDIGAKAEIHKIIAHLTREKMAVIMISSEMAEIIGASDRIMVLYKGKLMAELLADENLTQEKIMTAASGISLEGEQKAG